jgi:hypothetical protein
MIGNYNATYNYSSTQDNGKVVSEVIHGETI